MGTAAWHRKKAPDPLSFASLKWFSLVVTSAFLVSSPAIAKDMFPVSVPSECAALAVREGVGTVINNRYEAAKAKAKLFRLSDRDPEVALCRQAVKRLQDVARSRDAALSREVARDRLSSPVAEQAKPDVH